MVNPLTVYPRKNGAFGQAHEHKAPATGVVAHDVYPVQTSLKKKKREIIIPWKVYQKLNNYSVQFSYRTLTLVHMVRPRMNIWRQMTKATKLL